MRLALLAAVVLASTTVTPSAHAKDMKGKFGVGFTQTLGGVSGLTARYFAARRLAFELDVGASLLTKASSSELLLAFGILYVPVQHRHANLMIGVRGDLGIRTNQTPQPVSISDAINTETQSTTPEIGDSSVQVNIEVPIIVEFFFSDSFSINLSAGVIVIIAPSDGPILESTGAFAEVDGGEVAIGIGTGGLLGSAGFTFYF